VCVSVCLSLSVFFSQCMCVSLSVCMSQGFCVCVSLPVPVSVCVWPLSQCVFLVSHDVCLSQCVLCLSLYVCVSQYDCVSLCAYCVCLGKCVSLSVCVSLTVWVCISVCVCLTLYVSSHKGAPSALIIRELFASVLSLPRYRGRILSIESNFWTHEIAVGELFRQRKKHAWVRLVSSFLRTCLSLLSPLSVHLHHLQLYSNALRNKVP